MFSRPCQCFEIFIPLHNKLGEGSRPTSANLSLTFTTVYSITQYPLTSWQMSLSTMSNISKQKSSPCPALVVISLHFSSCHRYSLAFFSNGRQTVGDGAFSSDIPSVLVCHIQGTDDMYYYSTTFSGGPGVSHPFTHTLLRDLIPFM